MQTAMGHWELHKFFKRQDASCFNVDIKTTQVVFTLKTIYAHRDKTVTCSKTLKKTIVLSVKFLFGHIPAHKILSD